MPLLAKSRVAHRDDPYQCLFIGPSHSGKSCLLKTISGVLSTSLATAASSGNDIENKEKLFSTVYPTIGTELVSIQIRPAAYISLPWSNRIHSHSHNGQVNFDSRRVPQSLTVNLREVGGSLQPLWSKYYEESDAICIMIDGSCLVSPAGASATSLVAIANILTSEDLQHKPIAIVLTKIDEGDTAIVPSVSDAMWVAEYIFSLKQLFASRSKHLSNDIIICTSAKYNAGITDLIHWLVCSASLR